MVATFIYTLRTKNTVRVLAGILFFCSILCFSVSTYAQKKSDFISKLVNLESTGKTPFQFNGMLHNANSNAQVYQLQATSPMGWTTTFRSGGQQIAAIRVDSGRTEAISIEVSASPLAKAGKYEIPVTAISDKDSLKLNLEAVLTGNYGLQVSTPSGLLSTNATEGSDKSIELIVTNTGTLPLDGIEITSQTPNQWNANFDTSKIIHLAAGQTQQIKMSIAIPDKTIAGDYLTTVSAKNINTDASAQFRITVKTSLLSGWVGILVILIAIGIIYYLIRKYGRR